MPPAQQPGQGISLRLYAELEHVLEQHDAWTLTSDVQENRPRDLAFAERHGFSMTNHVYTSTLDLAHFDAARLQDVLRALKARGIQLHNGWSSA